MNLARPSILGLALLGNVCACDDSIGRDTCVGADTNCRAIPVGFYQSLDLDGASIERLPAVSSGALSIRWRLDPCEGGSCSSLASAGPDQSAWLTFANDPTSSLFSSALEVHRYGLDGELRSAVEIEHAQLPSMAGFAPPDSNADGRLFIHVHWTDVDYESFRGEVLRVDGEGKVSRSDVPWAMGLSEGVPSYGVVPGIDNFDVFESAPSTHALRAYRGEGELAWQQTELMADAYGVVAGVVRIESGYAVAGATRLNGTYASPSLLFTDQFGNALNGFQFIADGQPKLRALANDQIAMAVMARQQPDQDPDAGDIVLFKVDPSGQLSGHQLQRTSYQELSLHAFTSDSEGNLFVSTQAGARDALVGLVCRVTVAGDARCFESEPDLTFRSLVALDARTLYAVTNETNELMLVELPE